MNNNNSLSHTTWNCKYHIVFAPKYRRKVAYGKLREDIRDIIIMLCKRKGVNIIEGEVCPDHIHLLIEIPPKMSVSYFMYEAQREGDRLTIAYDLHPAGSLLLYVFDEEREGLAPAPARRVLTAVPAAGGLTAKPDAATQFLRCRGTLFFGYSGAFFGRPRSLFSLTVMK